MKAIETIYKGYRFRSRLEARWAVFFDALKIEWQYEPEGFQAPDGTRYLPDFWLPKFDNGTGIYVEVKGCADFDWDAFAKPIRMVQQGLAPVLCLYGPPENRAYKLVQAARDGAGTDEVTGWDDIAVCFYAKYLPGHRANGHEYRLFVCPESLEDMGVEHAILAARGARFEFGQSGAIA